MNRPSAPAAHEPASAPPALTITCCLVGFMGAGKTSIGAALARELQWAFVDLDDVIEARTGKSVAQIFAEQGEDGFRALERDALRQVLANEGPQISALGGGAFIQPEIAALLNQHDVRTIFLDAPAEELYRRCVDSLGAATRPLLQDLPSFKKLYAERLPFYERADLRVSSANTAIPVVVEQIMGQIREWGLIPGRKDR